MNQMHARREFTTVLLQSTPVGAQPACSNTDPFLDLLGGAIKVKSGATCWLTTRFAPSMLLALLEHSSTTNMGPTPSTEDRANTRTNAVLLYLTQLVANQWLVANMSHGSGAARARSQTGRGQDPAPQPMYAAPQPVVG